MSKPAKNPPGFDDAYLLNWKSLLILNLIKIIGWDLSTTEKFNSYNKSKVKSMVVRPTCSLGQAEIETAVATPFTYLSDYTKKKIRNLEKRKTKLESYKNKLKSGEKLTPDQYEAGMLTL